MAVAISLVCVPACGEVAENKAAEPVRAPLGPPTAVFAEAFGYLHVVRELPGGDVLVADLFDRTVA